MNIAILFMMIGTGPIAIVLMIPFLVCEHFDKKAHADCEHRVSIRRVEVNGVWHSTECTPEQPPEWEITRRLRAAIDALLFI